MADAELTLLAQGAEARLFTSTFLGVPVVIKERFSKKYRHPDLDVKLTNERLSLEAKCMHRARRAGVDTPVVYFVDGVKKAIYMERIHGITAKAYLSSPFITPSDRLALAQQIGMNIAKLHSAGMTHGDLTTSNIMIRGVTHPVGEDVLTPTTATHIKHAAAPTATSVELPAATAEVDSSSASKDGVASFPYSVALIDFGLAMPQSSVEDKGVDLYVLERAMTSGHTAEEAEGFFEAVLEAYFATVADSATIRRKYETVRTRGRKRLAFG